MFANLKKFKGLLKLNQEASLYHLTAINEAKGTSPISFETRMKH